MAVVVGDLGVHVFVLPCDEHLEFRALVSVRKDCGAAILKMEAEALGAAEGTGAVGVRGGFEVSTVVVEEEAGVAAVGRSLSAVPVVGFSDSSSAGAGSNSARSSLMLSGMVRCWQKEIILGGVGGGESGVGVGEAGLHPIRICCCRSARRDSMSAFPTAADSEG